MRYRSYALALLLAAVAFAQSTQPAGEKEKIQALIAKIEKLEGAIFIRNGVEYDCAAAAKHLRMKWSRAGSRIKTARQFIEHLASKSSQSGKAYQIRFADGKTINSGDFLSAELDRMESPASQPAPSERSVVASKNPRDCPPAAFHAPRP